MLLGTFMLHANCQTIKIADFIMLRGKKKDAIESRLSTFNIHLYDTNELNNGRMQFTFQNETKDESALHYIDFLYLPDAQWNNRLSFQTQEPALVKTYLAEMKNLAFKFINKKIVDRRIYEVYSDGTNTIELINSQIKNIMVTKPCYIFAFYNTDEYQYAFANENKICSVKVKS